MESESSRQIQQPQSTTHRAMYAIYIICLVFSIALWLPSLRSPLWLDETGSFWQISAGFSEIWSRARHFLTPSSPEYAYVLWLSTKLFGVSEAALRIPSLIAMLGAAYLLFRAAREIFDFEFAIIATIIFCHYCPRRHFSVIRQA